MEMFERIRELRKNHLKLSQEQFGEKLGVTRSVIKNIELDLLARPEQKEPLIRLICETFHVSYEWLTTGQGEMYDDTKDSFVERLSAEYKLGDYATKIIESYLNLSDSQRDAVDGFLKSVSESFSSSSTDTEGVVDKSLDKTIKLYRAAKSEDNTEHEILTTSQSTIDRLKQLPKVTDSEDL